MKHLRKLNDFKLSKEDLTHTIGGRPEATMQECIDDTDPSKERPCGDTRTEVTFDGSWGSLPGYCLPVQAKICPPIAST